MSDQNIEIPKHKSAEERLAMLNRIAEQAEQNTIKEALESGRMAPTKEIDVEEVTDEMNQHKENIDLDEKQEEKVAAPAKVIAKVDGQEEEVEIEFLTSQYQKFRHAEEQMKRAAEERKRVEQEKREIEMMRQQMLDMHALKMKELEQGRENTPSKPAEKTPEVKDALSTLLMGDEDKAAKSLEDAINARVQAEIERRLQEQSTKMISEAEQAAQKKIAEAQAAARWQAVVAMSQTKNPEFFQDEVLASVWEGRVKKAYESGLTPEQAAAAADADLAKRFGKPEARKEEGFKVDQAEISKVKAEKEEAKRFKVDQKTTAASSGKQVEVEDESPSDIIAWMKANRGKHAFKK